MQIPDPASSQSGEERAKLYYYHGKVLDCLPSYTKEAEDCLSKALKNDPSNMEVLPGSLCLDRERALECVARAQCTCLLPGSYWTCERGPHGIPSVVITAPSPHGEPEPVPTGLFNLRTNMDPDLRRAEWGPDMPLTSGRATGAQ